jgi:hypothetical protein
MTRHLRILLLSSVALGPLAATLFGAPAWAGPHERHELRKEIHREEKEERRENRQLRHEERRELRSRVGPPPAPIERFPPPRPGFVWSPGYPELRDGRSVWVSGHSEAERPGFFWQGPRWELQGGEYVFLPGAWVSVEAQPAQPPPPPPVERVEPRPGFIWVPGYHEWRAGRYVWIGGHYEAVQPRAVWEPGHWELRGRRYFWIPGAWRSH